MEIEIEITREDYQKFSQYVIKKNKTLKIHRLFLLIFLVLIILLLNIKELHNITHIVTQIIFGLFIYFAIIFLLKPITALVVRRIPSKDGGVLGRHKFRISDEGLWESTEYNESLLKWNGIKSIETSKKHIFVFIDTAFAPSEGY